MIGFLGQYKKVFGIFGLLVFICCVTAFMAPESFLKATNIENTVRWTALFGIISIGVSFVIMTGGIDLSIGSVIGLIGCLLAMFLASSYQPADSFSVAEVNASARKLSIDPGALSGKDVKPPDQVFSVGDSLLFLDNRYSVAATDGQSVTLAEDIQTGSETGLAYRALNVVSLSDESTETVRRGTRTMSTRRLVVQGVHRFAPEDKLKLHYEVGLPAEFAILRSSSQQAVTEIKFLLRVGQRVRAPNFATVETRSQRMPTVWAISLALAVALLIGFVHGLLVTKLKLQPFVVTLCGLLIYRGLSRFLTGDQEQGFGAEYPQLKQYAKGDFWQTLTGNALPFDLPMPFIYMLIIGILAAIFLNKTIYGRYILALGSNEEAARYSGINTSRMTILAYMICSFCAGIAAILFALDLNSIQPSGHGEFYELYAISAAVLGGCSLRGGEGSILGVIIAAAVMRVLNNAINLIDGIDTSTEFAIIGLVILLGVIVDESVRQFASRRKASTG